MSDCVLDGILNKFVFRVGWLVFVIAVFGKTLRLNIAKPELIVPEVIIHNDTTGFTAFL